MWLSLPDVCVRVTMLGRTVINGLFDIWTKHAESSMKSRSNTTIEK